MHRFAAWITKNRKLPVLVWLTIFIIALLAADRIGPDYSEDFKGPESDSQLAYDMLQENLPGLAGDNGQLVFHAPSGVADTKIKLRIEQLLEEIAEVDGVSAVISPFSELGAAQISKDGTIAFATVNWTDFVTESQLPTQVEPILEALEAASGDGLSAECGGNPCVSAINSEGSNPEGIGILAAMIVLFITFGTFLAMGIPIFVALIAVGIAVMAIELISNLIATAEFSLALSMMIGLGVGIDYALFIVTRFRQDLDDGAESDAAVVKAMDTAGRAVLFAGITVVIALLGLFLIGMPFLYGPAVAASLTVFLTMIASLTLLPALLATAGKRLDDPYFQTLKDSIRKNATGRDGRSLLDALTGWVLVPVMCLMLPLAWLFHALTIRLPERVLEALKLPVPHRAAARTSHEPDHETRWHRWSAFVQRRPWPVLVATTALMLVLAIPVLSLDLGVADSGTDPKDHTTRKAYDLLAKGFGPGFNGPLQVVIDNAAGEEAIEAAWKKISADENVVQPLAPPIPSPNGRISMIVVTPKSSPQSNKTEQLLRRIQADLAPINAAGGSAHVAGLTAVFDGFAKQISEKLPYFILLVGLLSGLLLMMIFRSVAIPIKAVAMNLLGILSAFGVVVAIFQWGWAASLFGIDSTGPIMAFLPVMAFAIVFGLSMDYEVFLMSRIHEEWERTGEANKSVTEGVAATAGVITAAAVIMVVLFASFAFISDNLTIKLFGITLATSIFLDAFIIRSALVPAIMAILGKRAWWLPAWLDRILPKINVEG